LLYSDLRLKTPRAVEGPLAGAYMYCGNRLARNLYERISVDDTELVIIKHIALTQVPSLEFVVV